MNFSSKIFFDFSGFFPLIAPRSDLIPTIVDNPPSYLTLRMVIEGFPWLLTIKKLNNQDINSFPKLLKKIYLHVSQALK